MQPDSFNPITPEAAREVALAFMGQHMVSLKDLNGRLVEQASTLRPVDPNIQSVVNSIPLAPVAVPVAPIPPQVQLTHPGVSVRTIPEFHPGDTTATDSQFEFNFTYDIVKDLVDRVSNVESTCKKILALLEESSKGSSPERTLKKS